MVCLSPFLILTLEMSGERCKAENVSSPEHGNKEAAAECANHRSP
jgi:hypothetical protein